MGFNTVAFLLNDLMHELEKSPKTVAWALSHPPMGDSEEAQRHWRRDNDSVSEEHGEPRLHPQALEVLGTFHADHTSFVRAGQNRVDKLKIVRYQTWKTKKCVLLELPEWAQKDR